MFLTSPLLPIHCSLLLLCLFLWSSNKQVHSPGPHWSSFSLNFNTISFKAIYTKCFTVGLHLFQWHWNCFIMLTYTYHFSAIFHVCCNVPQRILIFTTIVLIVAPWKKVNNYSKCMITVDCRRVIILDSTRISSSTRLIRKGMFEQCYVWKFQVLKL